MCVLFFFVLFFSNEEFCARATMVITRWDGVPGGHMVNERVMDGMLIEWRDEVLAMRWYFFRR